MNAQGGIARQARKFVLSTTTTTITTATTKKKGHIRQTREIRSWHDFFHFPKHTLEKRQPKQTITPYHTTTPLSFLQRKQQPQQQQQPPPPGLPAISSNSPG
jgi:hypothetical protein